MLSIVKSMALQGLDGYLVDVQVDISNGIPSWEIIGLPDASIKEAKERVRIAIKNCSISSISKKIIINLAPAPIRKEGASFDLAIAISILLSLQYIQSQNLENTVFLGELSLDGDLKEVVGVLPICMEAKRLGIKRIILPKGNEKEACMIEDLEIICVTSLLQTIQFLNGFISISPSNHFRFSPAGTYSLDFFDVKGQEYAKRAFVIAAAGKHHLLLIGPPGCGKTMLTKRFPSILPSLTFEEILEVSKIHSICNTFSSSILLQRPFRSPHHTISSSSLVGGGKIPKPGEVSLAHLGILFLDEFTQFSKSCLDALRIPLENKQITINRSLYSVTYPCNFLLVASMNPCPCGYYGSKIPCKCTPHIIDSYLSKISGPLLDRIDMQVEIHSISYSQFHTTMPCKSSMEMKQEIEIATNLQKLRYQQENISFNGELTPKLLEKYCKLDEKCKKIFTSAFDKLKLSVRSYHKVLKIARTIADLDGKFSIQSEHLLEALHYNTLDKKYWKKRR